MTGSDSILKRVWREAKHLAKRERDRMIHHRDGQFQEVVPVLLSMPWSKVVVGRARLDDIETFIDYYGMYVPLLARHKTVLVNARDCGLYRHFELYASAEQILVTATDREGNKKNIVAIREHYWEETFSFTPVNYAPPW